jgi:transposase
MARAKSTGHLPGSANAPPVPRATWGGPVPRGGGRGHVQWGVCASSASTGATLHSAGRLTLNRGGQLTETYDLLIGIDWATQTHQVCLLTLEGEVLEEQSVDHNATAIHAFVESALRRVSGDASRIAVAIEVPRGALVETLLERGLHVYALNPKQLDRFRDRHSVAGAKDDRLDAYVLADALRTDLHKFRRLAIDHPLVIQIRELSRADEDLREELNRLTNRLREQLHRSVPHLLTLSPSADEPWFWELAERVTGRPGRRLTRTQAEKLLRRHRIRRLGPDDLCRTLSEEPLRIAPGAAEAARTHIALLIPRLRVAHDQRKAVGKQLRTLLAEYAAEEEDEQGRIADVTILASVPGVGPGVTATLLAEAAPLLVNREYHALRALGGLAPVTKRSGKSRVVLMRYGCNKRLRNAFYHWARTSIQHDEASRSYYGALRARGHSHGRALRSVADRWLRILMAMLQNRTTYDPHHQLRLRTAA